MNQSIIYFMKRKESSGHQFFFDRVCQPDNICVKFNKKCTKIIALQYAAGIIILGKHSAFRVLNLCFTRGWAKMQNAPVCFFVKNLLKKNVVFFSINWTISQIY